jgi:hypothetical protein
VLTHNLADQTLETLGRLIALPERSGILVVDKAWCEDTGSVSPPAQIARVKQKALSDE